jgi:hypothetical protein
MTAKIVGFVMEQQKLIRKILTALKKLPELHMIRL